MLFCVLVKKYLPDPKSTYSSMFSFKSFVVFSFMFRSTWHLKLIFKIFYLFIFREGERKRDKHQCVVASHAPPTGDLARNPGMCPDWESNQQPLASQAGTQPTEPHQPGLKLIFLYSVRYAPRFFFILITYLPTPFSEKNIFSKDKPTREGTFRKHVFKSRIIYNYVANLECSRLPIR